MRVEAAKVEYRYPPTDDSGNENRVVEYADCSIEELFEDIDEACNLGAVATIWMLTFATAGAILTGVLAPDETPEERADLIARYR
jgi:hypothetical protein